MSNRNRKIQPVFVSCVGCICMLALAVLVFAIDWKQPTYTPIQIVACTPSLAHSDALEDTFRPMLLSLEWWAAVVTSTSPEPSTDDTSTLAGNAGPSASPQQEQADEDTRCSSVISIAVVIQPGGKIPKSEFNVAQAPTQASLAALFGAVPGPGATSTYVPPTSATPSSTPQTMWLLFDPERTFDNDMLEAPLEWFPATAYLGRFSWSTRLFSLARDPLRCNGVSVQFAVSAWDVITNPYWTFVQFRFTTCLLYARNVSIASAGERLVKTAAISVAIPAVPLTFWSLMFGWYDSVSVTRREFVREWIAIAGRTDKDTELAPIEFMQDALYVGRANPSPMITDCTSGPHMSDMSMLPLTIGSFPAQYLQVSCRPDSASTLDLPDEIIQVRARAHLRPIALFALIVYVHQLLDVELPHTRTLLIVVIMMDAPVWISIRLAFFFLVPWQNSVHDSLTIIQSPAMLLVAVAALQLGPTPVANVAIILTVMFDAFRGEQARRLLFSRLYTANPRRVFDQVRHRGVSKNIFLVFVGLVLDIYDSVCLPLFMILWVAVPALTSVTDDSPHAILMGFTVYLIAVPAYAVYTRS